MSLFVVAKTVGIGKEGGNEGRVCQGLDGFGESLELGLNAIPDRLAEVKRRSLARKRRGLVKTFAE